MKQSLSDRVDFQAEHERAAQAQKRVGSEPLILQKPGRFSRQVTDIVLWHFGT